MTCVHARRVGEVRTPCTHVVAKDILGICPRNVLQLTECTGRAGAHTVADRLAEMAPSEHFLVKIVQVQPKGLVKMWYTSSIFTVWQTSAHQIL